MRDGDWYLGYYSYDDMPGAALTFGRQASGIYCLSEPDIVFSDPEVGDQALPGEDGVRLGRDYQRQATVTFELGVDSVDAPVDRHYPLPAWKVQGQRIGDWVESSANMTQLKKQGNPWQWNLDGVSMLRQVWRADSIRLKPTRVAWLLHKTAGRTRRMYGRPRKFAVSHSRFAKQGYTPVVAEFMALDDRFYDDTEKVEEMWDYQRRGVPPRPGRPGWLDWVEKWNNPTKKSVVLSVAGRVPTYPVIVIHGPCKNPKVTVNGLWSAQLTMTIKSGEYVTIDARSWARTVLLTTTSGTSSSVADKLTRASGRLGDMYLPPGSWTAALSYTNASTAFTTGPRVEIKWRDAHTWW